MKERKKIYFKLQQLNLYPFSDAANFFFFLFGNVATRKTCALYKNESRPFSLQTNALILNSMVISVDCLHPKKQPPLYIC